MKITNHQLSCFGPPREIVVAAVQFAPHDMDYVAQTKTFEWKPGPREGRLGEIRAVLQTLLVEPKCRTPDVVVFPEYGVPKAAFDSIAFQDLADRHKTVIVAGSYFETERGPNFRCNVSRIFVPGAEQPIEIGKLNSSPDEIDRLLPASHLPNVARFECSRPDGGTSSISVFLCRDYLTPFDVRTETASGATERVSTLDWDREGLNIVLQHNLDSTLFEGVAALDVRRLHGQRKLVLFVNSALSGARLSTALLGASRHASREADVVAKLPTGGKGILLFEARLWDVSVTRSVPDATVTDPVVFAVLMDFEGTPLSEFASQTPLDPNYKRAVFHPAFLSAFGKNLVLEFYVARSVAKVDEAFSLSKIRHVAASYVRGVQDVVIRRYVDDYLTSGDTIPSLGVPFSFLKPHEFRSAFDAESGSPFLRVLVLPRGILKFRGIKIAPLDDEAWTALNKKITSLYIEDRAVVQEILDISKGAWDSDIPGHVADAFLPQFEDYQSVGGKFSANQLRETYLLVSVQREDNTSATSIFRIYIDDALSNNVSVREICVIKRCDHGEKRSDDFQFLLKLKCSCFEADEIIYDMLKWAALQEVRIGVRSYDLWHTLRNDAVAGIDESTLTPDQLRFLTRLHELDPRACQGLDLVRLDELSTNFEFHFRVLGKLPNEQSLLQDFFLQVCLHFLIDAKAEKLAAVSKSQRAISEMYKTFERLCAELLTTATQPTREGTTLYAALCEKIPSLDVPKDHRDPIRLFGRLYGELVKTESAKAVADAVRKGSDVVTGFRNLATHGGNEERWSKLIDLSGSAWNERLVDLSEKLGALCRLLKDLQAEKRKSIAR